MIILEQLKETLTIIKTSVKTLDNWGVLLIYLQVPSSIRNEMEKLTARSQIGVVSNK